MEQAVAPGSTLITADTLRLEGYVEVKTVGPLPVKGLPEPIEVYELTGAGQARTRFQAATARGLTRFVGRETEIGHLRRVLGQAEASHGHVVAIVGEAGVGKSRLVYELTHFHRIRDWLVLEAASVSYGKATSYLPVIDLLKGYFKIKDRDDHQEMRDKVLGRVLGLDRALEPLLTPLLALLDLPIDGSAWQALDPAQRRQRTIDAVKRLLLRESQVQPLLVVFEDLHWIDSETQALLDSLVDSLGPARLLLLVNYRPEYEHRWGSKTYYSQVRLDTLPAQTTAELLRALVGTDPWLEPLTQMLVKQGNPFFLEETVRALMETGVLAGERGAYQLTRAVDTLHVPATVQTVLTARIDRLPAEEKELLQAASMIGKDLPHGILAAIVEQPEEALRRGLVHLQDAEFLYQRQLFPDLDTFKHALTHEVTYHTLLHERRRTLHTRIVEAIERLYTDRLAEHVDKLAHHAERGEMWETAVRYLREAGIKAFERSANREAAASLERALSALARLPESRGTVEMAIAVRCDIRNALVAIGEFDRIFDNLRAAEHLTNALNDKRRLARVLSLLSHSCMALGEHDQAVESGEKALRIAQAAEDLDAEVMANAALGAVYFHRGEFRRAIGFNQRNIDILDDRLSRQRFGLAVFPAVSSRGLLAVCLTQLGQFAEAVACGEGAVRLAGELGHPQSQIYADFQIGYLYARRGDFDQAVRRLLALCQSTDTRGLSLPWVASFLGFACASVGRLSEGLALLQLGVETAASIKQRVSLSILLGLLSEAELLAGRRGDALASAERALNLSRQQGERGWEALTLRVLGLIAVYPDSPEVKSAEMHLGQAIMLATDLGMRPLVAHCHLDLGMLYTRTGEREEARQHVAIATTMYREMNMRFWLEKAEAAIAGLR